MASSNIQRHPTTSNGIQRHPTTSTNIQRHPIQGVGWSRTRRRPHGPCKARPSTESPLCWVPPTKWMPSTSQWASAPPIGLPAGVMPLGAVGTGAHHCVPLQVITATNDRFRLNDRPLKFRGFSHHNSLAGVGVAIPDRLNLFMVPSCATPYHCV